MFTRRAGAAGRRESLAQDVLAFLEPLYATALRLTGQPADAEDLVQDTYVKALRFADSFEPGTNLRAWLYTILHNTWRNRVREASRARVEANTEVIGREEARAELTSTFESPEQLLLRKSIDADLQSALDALPEQFRQAVWLRDVEEFSYAEIAQMLAIPMGTVMSRIARGRRMMYERLTADGAAVAQPVRVVGEPA